MLSKPKVEGSKDSSGSLPVIVPTIVAVLEARNLSETPAIIMPVEHKPSAGKRSEEVLPQTSPEEALEKGLPAGPRSPILAVPSPPAGPEAESAASTPVELSTEASLQGLLAATVRERDFLGAKLNYTLSTVLELRRQNRELNELLIVSQGQLMQMVASVRSLDGPEGGTDLASKEASHPSHPIKRQHRKSTLNEIRSLGSAWIGGTWLSDPVDEAFLGPAEVAWQRGKPQEALNLLGDWVVRKRTDVSTSDRVKQGLLFGAILRSEGRLDDALASIETALKMAEANMLHELVGKAQFHRGLCCLYRTRYADASWCFSLAAHTAGHEEEIDIHKVSAETSRTELPLEDPRRYLSKGFS